MNGRDKRELTDVDKEALKFLDRDFNQCFQQLRHYDGQILEVCKFAFIGYTTLIGAALGLYQFGLKEGKTLSAPIYGIVSTGLVLGMFFFALAIRNRVYFVQIARYLNEQRQLFFRMQPLGFQNRSQMYTDPSQPPFFNWRSSQAWYSYIIAALNAVLLAILLFTSLPQGSRVTWVSVGSGFFFAAQLAVGTAYLKRREGKLAEEAVFGKKESRVVQAH
jgi:hypothetical protein